MIYFGITEHDYKITILFCFFNKQNLIFHMWTAYHSYLRG